MLDRVHRVLRSSCRPLQPRFVAAFSTSLRQQLKIERSPELKEIQFKTTGSTPVEVHVRPSLMESIEFNVHGGVSSEPFAVQQSSKSMIQIVEDELEANDIVQVELHVPAMLGLNLSLVQGNVLLHEKIEGDVRVNTGTGNITIDKVRGMNLQFTSNNGAIVVNSLVEGESVAMSAKQIECKKILAKDANIKLTKATLPLDSSFGAMYVAQGQLFNAATGSLRVGNIHGSLDIKSQDASLIQVSSVNGSLYVEDVGNNCNIDVHYDSIHQVASIEHASDLSCGGNIAMSINPSISAHLDLHGESINTEGCEFTDYSYEQLDEDYAIASGILVPKTSQIASTGTSGKINLAGAKESAMTTSFFSSSSNEMDEVENETPTIFAHACSGQITLHQLNWMDKLRQKHLKKD
ncbi:hypothetical protein THRCLA_04068 [Thraustotheca clavata]|uniref:Adhesin domain-containing protein n=1 Tax=Thraustotheca clavata TaxID=74557 RepID=A0A1W0A000_9STRA|nr:hypothetical protein THRCLA_04068 [Thraustotheca clavata]